VPPAPAPAEDTVQLAEVIEVTLEVADLFDRLGVRWLVGGSLASSLHGVPRSTQDVDFVADLEPQHARALVALAGADFYADEAMIAEAIRTRRSFNLLHFPTNFKVDVFVARRDALTRSELARVQEVCVRETPRAVLRVASPEDIVLQKLLWFQLGEQVSERQWSDALGVVRVRRDLDLSYLRGLAREAGLAELLERLLTEARQGQPD